MNVQLQKQEKFLDKMAVIGSEDYPNEPVPKEKRLPWMYLTVVWFGAAMFVGLYYAGVELGTSMGSLKNTFIAITIGALFLSTFNMMHGIVGQKTGCNAALTGAYAYGTKGAAIPGFHVTDIGWYVVMIAQFVVILIFYFPVVDVRVYAAQASILFLTNSFIGLRQMARLNLVAMPILMFVGLLGIYKVGVTVDGGLASIWNATYPNEISITAAVTVVIGTWISGSSRAADYYRWAKSPWDTVKAAYAGFFLGYMICIVAGVFWGAGANTNSIPVALSALGIVPLGLLMFFLQTWTTNEHSGYVTSNALPVFYKAVTGKEASRRRITMGLALFSIFIAGLGIEKYYIPFITFLGIFVPVIGAIVLTDFYIMSRTKYHWTGHKDYYSFNVNDEDVQHHTMNWAVVPSIILGLLIGFGLPWGIASVNSLLGTAIVYVISCLVLSENRTKEMKKNEELAIIR